MGKTMFSSIASPMDKFRLLKLFFNHPAGWNIFLKPPSGQHINTLKTSGFRIRPECCGINFLYKAWIMRLTSARPDPRLEQKFSGCQMEGVNMNIGQKENNMTYDELKPRLAGVEVKDLRSDSIDIESLWINRPILLSFLRHFG